jgi:hypothetical protein
LVHIIERSSPFSGLDDPEAAGESEIQIICCPKSGVNFFDLGAFDQHFDQARMRAQQHLEQYQAVLSALPQLSEQDQPQVVSHNSPANAVILPGSLGGVSAGSGGAGGRQELVLAVASSGGTAGSSPSGSAAAPLATPRQTSLSPSRSTVRRAVQEDSSS